MSSAIAPTTSTISGKTGRNVRSSFIDAPSLHQRRGFGRANGLLVAVDQRADRRRRNIEHRLWIDPQQNSQYHQRDKDRDLAIFKVGDTGKVRLFQLPEDDLAIEPQRIAR